MTSNAATLLRSLANSAGLFQRALKMALMRASTFAPRTNGHDAAMKGARDAGERPRSSAGIGNTRPHPSLIAANSSATRLTKNANPCDHLP